MLEEASCEFRQQFINMQKVLKQQVPFYTVRKPTEDKQVADLFQTTVAHKLYDKKL